ncbi:MAG: helix-turn-helix domain-containing protein [Phycisphaerales bacterium]|jgi:DNA-binding HxlR family transcriptional regulator
MKRRSPCPIACSLDVFGDRWTLVVVRDLFAGKQHYHEFAASPEGIATNILADRLGKLVKAGLVAATKSEARVGSLAYSLTPKGRALYPVLEAVAAWGLANVKGTRALIRVPRS